MANVWHYRAKRVGDGLERAVNEQQLAKVASLRSRNGLHRRNPTGRPGKICNTRTAERTRMV